MKTPAWLLGVLVLVGGSAGCSALVAADFDGLGPKSDAGVATSAAATSDESGPAAPPPSSSPPPPASADGGTQPEAKDAGAHFCVGTVRTCAALASEHTACVTQAGCSWSAPACTVTTNCGLALANSSCVAAKGCVTNLATSTCVADTAFCVGTTHAACESKAPCAFTGGCAGVANKCADLGGEASCLRQGGCAWQ